MPVSQKIQTTGSIITGSYSSISGNVVATGNAIVGGINQYFAAASSNVSISLAFTLANLQSIFMMSDKGCTLATNGTTGADVQTISITGTPTGGSFALGFNGQVTSLPYNATSSQVQTALQALSTIGAGNVTCTGGPLPGTPVVCTFAGTLATGQQPLLTEYSGALTGGTSPAVVVTHTTPGLPTQTFTLQPGTPIAWAAPQTYPPCPFTSNVTTAYVTNTYGQNLQINGVTS